MGGGGSVSESKSDKLEAEVNAMVPHLPVAEMLNGGLIRITGFVGFFNVDALLEPSWLKGKLTVDECKSAIQYINKSAIRSLANFSNNVSSIDITQYESTKAEAIKQAVAEINRRHSSVRFIYQQGAKVMSLYPVWRQSVGLNIIALADGIKFTGPESYIFININ